MVITTAMAQALPKHMDVDRLMRLAMTTIRTTLVLKYVDVSSLLGTEDDETIKTEVTEDMNDVMDVTDYSVIEDDPTQEKLIIEQ
ncbi:hypothetical protein ABH966_003359 [Lysinibacillus sp. RC46]|uniref:hypothetical protein n=1 Tax=unclassified Lysinibacillus TaxID=2636778 RepID=UPI003518FA8C